jgi:hypothetical protein
VREDDTNGAKNAFSKSMPYCRGFSVCADFQSLVMSMKVEDILPKNLENSSKECLRLIRMRFRLSNGFESIGSHFRELSNNHFMMDCNLWRIEIHKK